MGPGRKGSVSVPELQKLPGGCSLSPSALNWGLDISAGAMTLVSTLLVRVPRAVCYVEPHCHAGLAPPALSPEQRAFAPVGQVSTSCEELGHVSLQ